jgi:hypothetical protein
MKLPAALLAFTMATSALHAQAPDAQAILEGARIAATLTQLDEGLSGSISKGGKKVPITLFLKGKEIQFQFSEDKGPWQIFHMRLADERYDLFEIKSGKTINFPAAKLVEPIAKSDITYEDLALRFFYWPNPKHEGMENIGGRPCHKLRINKPANAPGRYEAVYVWVDQKFGAFMQIRGHDKTGALIKEFQVRDVMKVGDVWTLKRMQVSTNDPKTGRRSSITDLIFDTPNANKIKRRGLGGGGN